MKKIVNDLIKEINTNLDKQEELRNKLKTLRNGKVVIKKRNNNSYYYLEYRVGKKVITDYIGKCFTGEISKYLDERKEYADTKFALDVLVDEEKQLKKALQGFGIKHYRIIYSLYEINKILRPIFKRFDINKAFVFGSYARGEANKESDVDLICSSIDTNRIFDFEEEVRNALGKDVDFIYDGDVVTKEFSDRINSERILIYEL